MIYADYAATNGVLPPYVREAVMRCLEHPGNPGRGTHHAAMDAARAVLEARIRLAGFFDCGDPAHVAFTSGATESLNAVIAGLIAPGDHVVTTRYEHNSVLRPLYRLEAQGASLTVTDGSAAEIEAAIRPDTRAVVMTHASNVTGEILDIRAAGEICAERGVMLIVDAAQTAGVVPISMRDAHIDALCFAGHKGLLGLQGVGGVAVKGERTVRPFKVGGSGIRSFDRTHPTQMPEALEAGTLNVPGIVSLSAALEEIERRGLSRILEHERLLAQTLEREIEGIAGVHVYRNPRRGRVGIVSLNIEGMDAGLVADRLQTDYGIETRAGAHCAPLVHRHYGTASMVRFSFGWESTLEEVMACARAIGEIAQGRGEGGSQ